MLSELFSGHARISQQRFAGQVFVHHDKGQLCTLRPSIPNILFWKFESHVGIPGHLSINKLKGVFNFAGINRVFGMDESTKDIYLQHRYLQRQCQFIDSIGTDMPECSEKPLSDIFLPPTWCVIR
jgi:hypothetical protein